MRRLFIDAIDTAVAVILSVTLSMAVVIIPNQEIAYLAMNGIWCLVAILYFVVLKGSRFRTVGYAMARARIVNFRGERPGYLALAGRLAFAVFGPVNFFIDLLWVSSDPRRQALRDKFAHTYVIRQNAVPIGTSPVVYLVYTVFGGTLLCAEPQEELQCRGHERSTIPGRE
jgi:uncharacterized RDD family membrane protein YckC